MNYYIAIFYLICFSFLGNSAFADRVEIFSPETHNHELLELEENESAELTVYLKSFGDLVGNYKVSLYDEKNQLVGRGFSDSNGLAKFTGIPVGKYRVYVEKRINERGGVAAVAVGDMKLIKVSEAEKSEGD